MKYFKVSLGIFATLAASRFIPHPPNFTSLIALSFYIPAIIGTRYIPAIIISFAITDFFIGFHNLTLFTWGSVLIISFIAKYLKKNVYHRKLYLNTSSLIFARSINFVIFSSVLYMAENVFV